MRELIERAFACCGMDVTVEHGAEARGARAFIQPVRRESGREPFEMTPLGAAERRFRRYLGSADVPVEPGDRVCCGDARYRVRDAAPVSAGREIVYYWAMLHPEEELCRDAHGAQEQGGENDDGNGTGESGGGGASAQGGRADDTGL